MTGTAGVTYEIRGAETQAVCRQTQTNHMQAFIRKQIHTKHKETPLPVHPLNEHICGHLCGCLWKTCSDVTLSWGEVGSLSSWCHCLRAFLSRRTQYGIYPHSLNGVRGGFAAGETEEGWTTRRRGRFSWKRNKTDSGCKTRKEWGETVFV